MGFKRIDKNTAMVGTKKYIRKDGKWVAESDNKRVVKSVKWQKFKKYTQKALKPKTTHKPHIVKKTRHPKVTTKAFRGSGMFDLEDTRQGSQFDDYGPFEAPARFEKKKKRKGRRGGGGELGGMWDFGV